MSTSACMTPVISLSRPWPARLLERTAELWHALRAHAAQREFEQWRLEDLAALSDRTLRDIGAPEWLRAEAIARRDAERLWALELRAGMTGLVDRGY